MYKAIGIIVAIAVIAGGAFFLMNKKTTEPVTKSNTDEAKVEPIEQDNSSLKTLMASGKNQKCTFSFEQTGATGNGIFYVSEGKSRGDISTYAAGIYNGTHVIYDNNTSYVWMDGQSSGYKMAISAEQVKAAQEQNQSQAVDLNKDYNFKCSGWSADSSMFKTPSNIEFKEFNIPITPISGKSSSSAGANSMMNADTVCAALTGTAKTECVAAMQKR